MVWFAARSRPGTSVGWHHLRDGAGGPVRLARAGQRNLYPADAALGLPRGATVMGCGGWPPWRRCAASSRQATQAIGRRCGQVVGKRGIEQLTVAAATDIDAFYAAVVPQPATDTTVLVGSVDGKGVVMRPRRCAPRPPRPRPPRAQAATGPGWPAAKSRVASGWRRWESSTTPTPHPPAPRRHDPDHYPPRRFRWWWSAVQGPGRRRQVADRLDRHRQRAGDQPGVRPSRAA